MSSRRQFLQRALLSGATLPLLDACQKSTTKAIPEIPAVDSGALRNLRKQVKGTVILPGDSLYEEARWVASRNPLTDKKPKLIVQCTSNEDVQHSIEFAQKYKLTTAVRSGGHSFAGWSSCDDGIVIDLSPMRKITFDPLRKTVRVGAGFRSGELVSAVAQYGLAPVLGECASVGVAGLTMGGGLGWLSAMHGAACDNLLSADLVTLDSKFLATNSDSHPGLFWAIRGGGGNFGIATSLEFQLHPIDKVLAGGFTYPLDKAVEVLRFYRGFMVTAPDQLQALAYLFPGETPVVNIVVVCQGDLKQAEKSLAPFSKIAKPIRNTVQPRAFSETFTMPPYGEFPPTKFGVTRGTYVQQFSTEVIEIAVAQFERNKNHGAIGFDHYMHGEVCRVAPDATAFPHRMPGALHVWVGSGWNDPADNQANMDWTEESWKKLQPYTGGRIYANYIGNEVPSSSSQIFDLNLSRLESVKAIYDPNNFLRLNQNVLPVKA